jgi:hypothetical protein
MKAIVAGNAIPPAKQMEIDLSLQEFASKFWKVKFGNAGGWPMRSFARMEDLLSLPECSAAASEFPGVQAG